MSYGFNVTKDKDGIRLEEVSAGALEHIPDGRFAVQGHAVAPGTSAVETIAVTLTEGGEYRISAQAAAQARKPAPDPGD